MTNITSKYLVTGSSGFLGFHFIKFLRDKKIKAVGIYNSTSPKFTRETSIIQFKKCDLLNTVEVLKLPAAKTVVHFAARVSGTEKVTHNQQITENIVTYCNQHEAKLIFISSSQVLYSIQTSYIQSKKQNETYIKKHCEFFTIVRPAAPYGEEITQFNPGRKQPLHILSRATKLPFIPIVGKGENTRQPLYVDDLNRFIFMIASNKKANHKTYNIGGPALFTYDQIVDIIAQTKNRHPLKIHVPVSIAKIMAQFVSFTDSENIVASTINEKVTNNWKRDFSLELTPFEKGCQVLP